MKKWLLSIAAVMMVACSSIDCPVNNTVATLYNILDADGQLLELSDTITVTSLRQDGTDTTLLNKLVASSEFNLPISYSHPEDILVFNIYKDSVSTMDTVWIKKDDFPHFESVDCNATFFHQLTSVRYTTNGIDSIVINNPSVDYDYTTVHFLLYPKSSH